MKKSLNAWTVDAKTGFEQMFKELKEAGFGGVELNVDKEGTSEHSLTLSTTAEDLAKVLPSEERLNKGPVAITECFQEIACNPCVAACPHSDQETRPHDSHSIVHRMRERIGISQIYER